MCGIAGFYDPAITEAKAGEVIVSMLDAISHRGPDARGTWWNEGLMLGHNRLSIIDLSHSADQPMHYGDTCIIFNGEIYNYLEIKRLLVQKGYQFATSSDTEVILASYQEWGVECVRQFVGMWAFVLFDAREKKIFASRDRFGIKPFYFFFKNSAFYFASEFKALKTTPYFQNELNVLQISRTLQMGWLGYADETPYAMIHALPAAHNMIIRINEDGRPAHSVSRYWDLKKSDQNRLSFADNSVRFRELFAESVSLHMRSDVPVATCLSGGLDSSAIVSMVQTLYPGQSYKSFSIYYSGDGDVDERPFISEVIKKYPAIEPYYMQPSEDEVSEEFHRALYHADVPAAGSSFLSQYFLMKLISSQGIKVVLDGQGSDEYLAGYMHSFYRMIAGYLRKGNLFEAVGSTRQVTGRENLPARAALAHFGKSVLSSIFSEQNLYKIEYEKYYPFLLKEKFPLPVFRLPNEGKTKLDSFLYNLLFTTSLPSLLQYEDRNSMAFSIESRVPFLDHRLVEYVYNLPDKAKISGVVTKSILRNALKDILPEAIANRSDKKGFVTPGESKWLHGPLKHLLEIDYQKLDFLDTKKIRQLVEEYKKGDSSKAVLIWRVATLNYWIKHFC